MKPCSIRLRQTVSFLCDSIVGKSRLYLLVISNSLTTVANTPASQNCAVVRRATGGGAIVHDREITYSIAIPPGHHMAVKHLALYETVHNLLIQLLAYHGIQASLYKGEGRESDFAQPFLCFQRRTTGDLILSHHKIAGSAQRRYRGAILQHGSMLLSRSPTAPELPGIAEIAGKSFSFDQFVRIMGRKACRNL